MELSSRDRQSLEVARLYFQRGLSQADVARQLCLSRPTVSKLIQHAKDRGFVSIEIRDPRAVSSDVGRELCARYGLTQARVVAAADTADELLHELGGMGAQVLEENVADGDLVGITWGRTMRAVANALTPQPRTGVHMVQLKGGSSLDASLAGHHETVRLLCSAFDAYPHTLPLPVLFDSPGVKRLVEQDRHIKYVLDLGRSARTALFTVGPVSEDAPLLLRDYLSREERRRVAQLAVGDLCSRFIDASGRPAVPSLDERTVALPLDDLRQKEIRICVAGGTAKVPVLRAALQAGYVSHLVTDERTARAVLG
ncbi:sugar-binding transcriptional regulator [Kocuria tytonicola]|uniref:Sugar-binding transcriptional regulator n=1 Tax=Kocuria tytonicola TaxID=2055946 RepID=A0A3L9L0Q4_9MICC|nr:sugar-binding transcriptional regulator [Kocuria tytonicola]RLY91718.1 sugar-binding transcriptional regulator [Kocuria tytonicola]